MTDERLLLPEVDAGLPSVARVYDYYLGGSCNLKVDRDFARKVLDGLPEAREFARRNRAFLRRAVRYCAERGVRQFLDLGAGIPTVGHTHEIAQAIEPACRVVYVDNEQVAVDQTELLLAGDDRAGVVLADLRDPEAVLSAPVTRRLLDFDQPVAVLMMAMLHFVPDAGNPATLVRRYRAVMAPGSMLVVSHATGEGQPARVERAAAMYEGTTTRGYLRDREQIGELLAGFELVPPGVVFTSQWRPDAPIDRDDPQRSLALGAVGLLTG